MSAVTATNLPRLIACNGSRLVGGLEPPAIADDNPVRDEGNAADWVISQLFYGHFKADELIERKAPNGVYITVDMIEHLTPYLNDITVPADVRHIEFKTRYDTKYWVINGRADFIKYDQKTKTLTVADFKYGWSIVEPVMNWTLLSHAISYIYYYQEIAVDIIEFKIYQPRPYHSLGSVRTWKITAQLLDSLRDKMVEILDNLTDELRTTTHCYKCPALLSCPAARNAQMNAIESAEYRPYVENIDNERLSFELDHLNRAIDILEQRYKAYKDLAMHRLKDGQVIKNYGVENGLSNRDWQDHVTPEFLEMITGKDLSKKKLITPAQAEKMGVSKDVVSSLTERHNTGVKLVRVDAHTKAEKHLKGN